MIHAVAVAAAEALLLLEVGIFAGEDVPEELWLVLLPHATSKKSSTTRTTGKVKYALPDDLRKTIIRYTPYKYKCFQLAVGPSLHEREGAFDDLFP